VNPFGVDLHTVACPQCPHCHQPPGLVVSSTQAMCGNDDCGVIMWNLQLPDGGMDDPQYIDLPGDQDS